MREIDANDDEAMFEAKRKAAVTGRMVPLRYIGEKAWKVDTLFGTKVRWRGAGDVQVVPEHLAPSFLAYPSIWQPEHAYWKAPQDIGPASDELASMVRHGDWDAIAKADPQAFEAAAAYFGPNDARPMALPLFVPEAVIEGWAAHVLAGSRPTISEHLAAMTDVLRAYPVLLACLADMERRTRGRRVVLDLLAGVAARIAAAQGDLVIEDGELAEPATGTPDSNE
jgi:hypothetical protein